MQAYIAAVALLLGSVTGTHSQNVIFCGGADTSGHCSAPQEPPAVTIPQVPSKSSSISDEMRTSSIPRAQNNSSTGNSSGGGFVDQPIGRDTSIRTQQTPSLGTGGSPSRSVQ
jgi:hypothetical protein